MVKDSETNKLEELLSQYCYTTFYPRSLLPRP